MKKSVLKIFIGLISGAIIFGIFILFQSKVDNVGLYEHIRQAQEYIEEEKYDKAIVLFHKAYEGMPENNDIKQYLAFGYVKYARFLDKNDDLESAIENLEIAAKTIPTNKAILNELAFLYAKKSVNEYEKGNIEESKEFLDKSIILTNKAKSIKKNISAYLYNKGVEFFNENNDDVSLMCLETSRDMYPRGETFKVLGHLYYKRTELYKAIDSWERALKINPEDEEILKNIEKLKKEMPIDDKTKKIETKYFNLQFNGESNVDIIEVQNTLNKIYIDVGKELDFYPPVGTLIVFYNEFDFRDIFKTKGVIRAFYDGNIRMAFDEKMTSANLLEVITHEYTHAVLSMMTDNNCPIWLHEGLAVYEQAKYMDNPQLIYVFQKINEGGSLTINEIEQGFSQIDHHNIVGLSYEGAYTAVLFIIEKWGWEGLIMLLDSLKEGNHYANALDEVFYVSVKDFENMWNKYIIEKEMRS